MAARVGGMIQFLVNGQRYDAKGSFDVGLGFAKREAVVGADGVHGYKETPQVPYVDGAITDNGQIDIEELMTWRDAQVVVVLANGRTFSLNDAWWAGDGVISTEEGEIAIRFEGRTAAFVS